MGQFTRRNFLKSAGIAGMAGITFISGGCADEQRIVNSVRKPNLLFVFSDQQSYDMLGCYGNPDIITPNLDRMAEEGIRFNHCVSSCPVCTPYRGMLMSGQHPLYNGAYINDVPLLADNGKYIGHLLRDAGYRTAYIGKWHLLGGDRDRPIPPGKMRYGFDNVFLSNNCHVDFRPGKCYYWNEQGEKVYFNEWEVFGQTRQAMDFLDTCTPDAPFALFISWHPPHDWGWQGDSMIRRYDTIRDLMDLYNPDRLTLRPNVADTPAIRKAYHGYYATCSGVDIAFGRVMDKLKEKGLDENTLIVFTSDHGDNLSSYDYTLPKNHPEDTSVRVPMLMRLPCGYPRGRKTDLLLGTLDIMPTLLGLMQLPIPNTVQGQDLSKAVLQNREEEVESVPLFFYETSWRGVYTHRFTYACGETGQWKKGQDGSRYMGRIPVNVLYDKEKDPHQLHNQYGQPSAGGIQGKLRKMMQDWLNRFEDRDLDPMQLRNRYFLPSGRVPESARQPGFPGRPIDLVINGFKTDEKGT